MPKYMLLLRDDREMFGKLGPEEMQKTIEKYFAWRNKPVVVDGAGLIENPRRCVFVVVSDFFEGGDSYRLVRTVRALVEQGTTVLRLAALDEQADPFVAQLELFQGIKGSLAGLGPAYAVLLAVPLTEVTSEGSGDLGIVVDREQDRRRHRRHCDTSPGDAAREIQSERAFASTPSLGEAAAGTSRHR